MGKMRQPKFNRPWFSFIWFALLLIGIISLLLTNSRTQLHQQIIDSEARFLRKNFAQNFEEFFLEALVKDSLKGESIEQLDTWFDTRSMISQTAVRSLEFPQVLGVQSYDQDFKTQNLPTSTISSRPSSEDFFDTQKRGWVLRQLSQASTALLVELELDNQPYFIEFTLSSKPFEESWLEIDSTLLRQGVVLSLTSLLILGTMFFLMSRKVLVKERLLLENTKVLQQTNEELSRAYKTTSLGAITGHLMHALRGHLTTLKSLASNEENLQTNIKRIQDLVQQTLGTIKDNDDGVISYTLSVEELLQIAKEKFLEHNPGAKCEILNSEFLGETVNNLHANLTLAILANLFQNSADAKTDVLVSILCDKEGPSLTIDISDNAGGISGGVKPLLFSPVNSTKKRGSGIGLALSKQLAESMGASLSLVDSNTTGTCFRLSIILA